MADTAKTKGAKAEPEKKPRGPVLYHAWAELAPGWWALVAADREASSQIVLRRELRTEIAEAQDEAGIEATDDVQLAIVPSDRAYIVTATRKTTITETFEKTKLSAAPPLASMVTGPPHAPTEAELAARAAAGPPPPQAPEPEGPGMTFTGQGTAAAEPPLPPAAARAAEAAAQAALRAEAGQRERAVMPGDPDDDETPSPDIDPATGLSRRPASQATPADEGRTVFPIEGPE